MSRPSKSTIKKIKSLSRNELPTPKVKVVPDKRKKKLEWLGKMEKDHPESR